MMIDEAVLAAALRKYARGVRKDLYAKPRHEAIADAFMAIANEISPPPPRPPRKKAAVQAGGIGAYDVRPAQGGG